MSEAKKMPTSPMRGRTSSRARNDALGRQLVGIRVTSMLQKTLVILTILFLLTGCDTPAGKIILYTEESPIEVWQNKERLKEIEATDIVFLRLAVNWDTSPTELNEHRRVIRALRKETLRSILPINLTETLPKWDTPEWTTVNQNIQNLATEAKRIGFNGFLLNTSTSATKRLWDPEYNPRYKDISDDFAEQIVYQRGREIMQAIESVYPQAEIIIYPAGPLEPITRNYTYWHHFTNGLLSLEHQHIHVTAKVRDNPEQILQTANAVLSHLLDNEFQIIPFHVIPPQINAAATGIIQYLYDNYPQIILEAESSVL